MVNWATMVGETGKVGWELLLGLEQWAGTVIFAGKMDWDGGRGW